MGQFTMSIDDKVFILIKFTEEENPEKTKMTWSGKGYFKKKKKSEPYPESLFSFSFSVGRHKNKVEDFSVHSVDAAFAKYLFADFQNEIVAGIMESYKH